MRKGLAPLLIAGGAIAVVGVTLVIGGKSGTAGAAPAPPLPTRVLVKPLRTLAQLRGHPAIVHFWASWCGPCKKEAPELVRLAAELRGRASLVGVDWSDTNHSSAAAFVREHRWTFPNLEDDSGVVGDRWGIQGLPTTFLLDANGRIVGRLVGPQTAAGLLRALRTRRPE